MNYYKIKDFPIKFSYIHIYKNDLFNKRFYIWFLSWVKFLLTHDNYISLREINL